MAPAPAGVARAKQRIKVSQVPFLVPLAEQDRTRWDQALIAEGTALLSAVLPRRAIGEYQLQAAIAAIHDQAATAAQTDWAHILALYRPLERMTGNPMVTLNRAIAVAMVDGPAAGLAAPRRPGQPAARPPPARRGTRTPAGDGRRGRHRDQPLPAGRRPHHQPRRTRLPHRQRRLRGA